MGKNGVFDITADGEEIYAKSKTGRFPEDIEIIRRIKSLP